MKTVNRLLFWLSVPLSAWLITGCQGEPPGNPEHCYFFIGTEITSNYCEPTGELGFNLVFRDENDEYTYYNDLVLTTGSGYFISLPSGHDYSAYLLSNGYQNNCSSMDFIAHIVNLDKMDTCLSIKCFVEERPAVFSPDHPTFKFSLPDHCDGCFDVAGCCNPVTQISLSPTQENPCFMDLACTKVSCAESYTWTVTYYRNGFAFPETFTTTTNQAPASVYPLFPSTSCYTVDVKVEVKCTNNVINVLTKQFTGVCFPNCAI
ncbi:MAG: hypothetical protein H6562_08575 [Lewinellaceae bacterium]|nr:hypothetical protein [Lewinellaceae bacterium]